MRNFNLNIAGYNIRFESAETGPDIVPSTRFLRNISHEVRPPALVKGGIFSGPDFNLVITVHKGRYAVPSDAERVFHAPFVEEINGIQIRHKANFWSIWKHGDSLYVKTLFPLTTPRRHAVLIFSLTSMNWDLWIESDGKTTDPFEYPLDGLILYYLTVIHRDIMIHASGVSHHGKGYIFSGISGKGKTTISGLWARSGATVIHDDRLILRASENEYIMHNTPVYNNDEPLESPIEKIFLIEHGTENRIVPVKGAIAVGLVMANCIQHNWGSDIISRLLETVSDLCTKVPVYKLSFKPDQTVIEHILEYESATKP